MSAVPHQCSVLCPHWRESYTPERPTAPPSVPAPPPPPRGQDLDQLACENAELRGKLEVNDATIRSQQAEIRKAMRHLSHALVCKVRLTGGCHPCRIAETWRAT